INKQYDNQFANSGASPSGKIGPSLSIRMPNQFTVRSGWNRSNQDITESTQTLTVSTVKGVDFTFSQADLTLTIDEFGARYLKPAMATLASNIEADALSMLLDVYNAVDDNANTFSYSEYPNARKILNRNLTPDTDRIATLTSTHAANFLKDIKGNFNPQESVSKAYLKGKIGMVNGFETFENTLLNPFQSGTAAATTGYTATLTS